MRSNLIFTTWCPTIWRNKHGVLHMWDMQHVRQTFHFSVSRNGVAYQWQSSACDVWDELLNSFFTLSISAHWTSVFRSYVPPRVLCHLWVFTRRALKIYVLYLHVSTQHFHSVLKQTHQNRKHRAWLVKIFEKTKHIVWSSSPSYIDYWLSVNFLSIFRS